MASIRDVEDCLVALEKALVKLRAAKGSMLKRQVAEMDMLACMQRSHDLAMGLIQDKNDGDRVHLIECFGGDCMRIAKYRSVFEAITLATNCEDDARLREGKGVIELVEDVLREQNYGQALDAAQRRCIPWRPPGAREGGVQGSQLLTASETEVEDMVAEHAAVEQELRVNALAAENNEMAAKLAATEQVLRIKALAAVDAKLAAAEQGLRIKALAAENQDMVARLAAAEQGLRILAAEKQDMAARLAAAEQEVRTLAAENEGMAAELAAAEQWPRTRALARILAAEEEDTAAKLAAAEQGVQILAAENKDIAARLAAAEQEQDCTILRCIHYGTKGSHTLDVYSETVITNKDGMLDETDAKRKRKGGMTFGDRVKLFEEKPTKSGPIWLRVQSLATRLDGWVVGKIPGKLINCVDMGKYGQNQGPIPADAYLGQAFPHDGMYTEGYPGKLETCLVSASGDSFWREVNIELLFRDAGTATVFEQDWGGGDADFTDSMALYACNCAIYGKIGSANPKRLIVTVKSTADYKTYPKINVDPNAVKADIGNAQFKECEWLWKNLPKKGFGWENVEFMTAFQFLKRYCNWSEEDCKKAAIDKASRVLDREAFRYLDLSQMEYQLEMVAGALTEAFDGRAFPGDILDILNESSALKGNANLLMEALRDAARSLDDERIEIAAMPLVQQGLIGPLTGGLKDADRDVRRAAATALGSLGDEAALPALQGALQDESRPVRREAAAALGGLGEASPTA